jgi:hypothetical protein
LVTQQAWLPGAGKVIKILEAEPDNFITWPLSHKNSAKKEEAPLRGRPTDIVRDAILAVTWRDRTDAKNV